MGRAMVGMWCTQTWRTQQRSGRKVRVIGDAKVLGDKAGPAKQIDFQARKARLLAENLLQFLAHLDAVPRGENVEPLDQAGGGDRQDHNNQQ